ncbi:multicopper oxidase family protein [Longispora sp. NPDC051575]|uniref:multicopper oxidase family protein n=1 Tax=Longispora sp. NPDC051575 TaxID=3154943 RepID=UPI00344996F3
MRRRTLLATGMAALGAGLTAACDTTPDPAAFVTPDGEEVRAAEARRNPGTIRDIRLTSTAGPVDLGGTIVNTWSYDGQIPGRPIRITAGEQLRATLTKRLPEPTSIHWHGVALRNDNDGVPDLTQKHIPTGADHTYQFTAPHPGTYWLHPHTGVQLDRGLYAPLIVDDPHEPGGYDDEWIIVLDDWLDGIAGTPDDAFAGLRRGMMGGHGMTGAASSLLGGDAGDVAYPHFLLGGRLPAAPQVFTGRPGSRIRLRIINAAADTAFRVALGGHRLTVTHTDGYPVQPVDTDALLLGMGERYDALVTLDDGVFPLVALAEGKNATAFGLVRTSSGTAPGPATRPRELDGRIVTHRQLAPTDATRLPTRPPDRTIRMALTGGMMGYDWAFNNRRHDLKRFEPIRAGERVHIEFVNTTMMWHPVHLHGHTFALTEGGARKDTAIVLPGQTLPVDFDADNPGRWMIHCHNAYHAQAGMMTQLGYLR